MILPNASLAEVKRGKFTSDGKYIMDYQKNDNYNYCDYNYCYDDGDLY